MRTDPPTQLSDWNKLQQSIGGNQLSSCSDNLRFSLPTQASFAPHPLILDSVAQAFLMSTLELDQNIVFMRELAIGSMLADSESFGFGKWGPMNLVCVDLFYSYLCCWNI